MFSFYQSLSIRVSRSASWYPARIIRLLAIRLALSHWPLPNSGVGSTKMALSRV